MSNPFEAPSSDVSQPPAPSLANPAPITVTYELHMATVTGALKHALLKSPGGWLVLAAAAGGLALLAFLPGFAAVLLIYAAWTIFIVARSAANPALGAPGQKTPITLSLSAGGVELTANDVKMTRRWAEMSHYAENPGIISLFPDPRRVWPVTTTNLAPEQLTLIRAWLSSCLPDKPRGQENKRAAWRVLALWILLILMFWAIYRIISTEARPPGQ